VWSAPWTSASTSASLRWRGTPSAGGKSATFGGGSRRLGQLGTLRRVLLTLCGAPRIFPTLLARRLSCIPCKTALAMIFCPAIRATKNIPPTTGLFGRLRMPGSLISIVLCLVCIMFRCFCNSLPCEEEFPFHWRALLVPRMVGESALRNTLLSWYFACYSCCILPVSIQHYEFSLLLARDAS
jgi:hypothetical protein